MKIQAAVLRKAGQRFSIEELDLAGPKKNEVLVRMAATGVCHSDWHLVTGATPHPMPVVPGHEGAGIIEAVGEGVVDLSVGDHVALNWAPSCKSCFYCKGGQPNLCATFVEAIWAGTMLDGTTRLTQKGESIFHFSSLACLAEKTVVPRSCCVALPKTVPLEVAALIGCAVTTGVGAAIHTAKVTKGSTVAVYGVGGVGLSVILGARYAGADKVIAIDRTKAKAEAAIQHGATHTAVFSESDLDLIHSITDGRGADFVFEAAGIPSVQERCIHAARPGGVIVFVGLSPVGSTIELSGANLTRQEKKLLGCYYGSGNPEHDFIDIASLYDEGKLDLDSLVSKTYSLSEVNEAYEDMLAGRVARGVITFPIANH